MRFFMYTLGDERVPIPPPTPDDMARMGAFMAEATQAGALIATGGFGPSSAAKKVTYRGGSCTVTDGPFTEAKELIGGWALVQAASFDEAVGWAERFLRVVGVDGAESRIRPVFGGEDLPPGVG
jgi:hypothetical protein